MDQKRLEILKNEKLTDGIYRMIFRSETKLIRRPGQFINIKLDGMFLRRPISVCDWDDKTMTIIYKTVGAGTELMSQMTAGSRLDVLLPLGNGFDTDKSGQDPVLAGGGVGIPPMFGLAKALIAEGKRPKVAMGFNDGHQVFLADEFKDLGAEVLIATMDGSRGTKGLVTDLIKGLDFSCLYACGPEPMLRALDMSVPEKIPAYYSFEERMGCGFGACLGCSCETKYGYKRICKDGPVLERGEIIW